MFWGVLHYWCRRDPALSAQAQDKPCRHTRFFGKTGVWTFKTGAGGKTVKIVVGWCARLSVDATLVVVEKSRRLLLSKSLWLSSIFVNTVKQMVVNRLRVAMLIQIFTQVRAKAFFFDPDFHDLSAMWVAGPLVPCC